jgi:hypothetical protein
MPVVKDVESRKIAGTMQGTMCESDMVVIRSASENYIIRFCSALSLGFDMAMMLSKDVHNWNWTRLRRRRHRAEIRGRYTLTPDRRVVWGSQLL